MFKNEIPYSTKKLPIENENFEDFKLILSDSTCAEISDNVEKITSDTEETIQKISKFITSTQKAKSKGQLISKCPFGVFISPKKQTNFFKDFCFSL